MEISACPLFRDIPREELPALLTRAAARRTPFQKGELLLRRGEVTHRLGLVLSGTVQAKETSASVYGYSAPAFGGFDIK